MFNTGEVSPRHFIFLFNFYYQLLEFQVSNVVPFLSVCLSAMWHFLFEDKVRGLKSSQAN